MIIRLAMMIIINALALYVVHYILQDDFVINPVWGYVVVGFVLGLLNAIIKPILSLLALPLVIITFGLFLSVINIFLLYFAEFLFSDIVTIGVNFTITGGFFSYGLAAILLSVINSILHFFIGKK